VTGHVDLTEDRTAKNPFMFPYMIASSILSAEDESFLHDVLAVRFSHELGFDVDAYPIVVTDALGPNILGMAENERIYVSRLALMRAPSASRVR
jgi:hypothetical protein